MSLSLYKKKRSFDQTPEPAGKQKSSRGSLRFVIQKHDATNLHYDFRLEMEGVLKSWAVPKGPSLNPEDKRLAMMVEDHPYDYREFEGVIPEGNYGGGTVIVWDEGFYEPLESEGLSRKEKEKLLKKQLYSGNLKFTMHGKKIKGEFALFQMKGRGENSWILMKKKDGYATEKNILDKNKSVKSGKTLAQVAKANGAEIKHPESDSLAGKKSARTPAAPAKKTPAKKAVKKTAPKKATANLKKAGSKAGKKKVPGLVKQAGELAIAAPMPENLVPMLASLVEEPFDKDDWVYEIKWDGYRAVAYCDGEDVKLSSRNLSDFTERYEPVATALQQLELNAVFDGEIVAVDEKGMAVFQSLQNWQNTPVHLQYFIFDLIWLDGYDISALSLLERKKILRSVIPENDPVIKYSDHVEGTGIKFFEAAMAQGLEGIMAKKGSGSYHAGSRTADWLKIKVNQRQEVVIAGYTRPRNSRKYFGALLLGVYEKGKLVYVGHTGSGFNARLLKEIHDQLQPLVISDCPFEKCPKPNQPVTWVKPELVCEIKFSEWTREGIARHPIFMGMRSDKKAKDVGFEKSTYMAGKKSAVKKTAAKKTASKKTAVKVKEPAKKTVSSKKSPRKSSGAVTAAKKTGKAPVKSKGLIQLDLSVADEQMLVLNGHELKLTNLNKLYWKKEKFSKGDMINYYLKIAPYIMPYMKDRPQSLNRHPNGIEGSNFYQKNQKGKVPSWVETHKDFSESTNTTVEYLVCTNEASLIYMANLGCIEMNPWHGRVQSWQKPDWCLIDLDPDDSNSFEQVMQVALKVKEILDAIGADAYCKTSGSTGLHILVPLGAKYSYDQSKQLAELVVTLVNHEFPGFTSIERRPANRKGKIYLDYLQNREIQTVSAPYSLRPKPGIPVSTPLDWSELKKGLTSRTCTAKNIFERLAVEGDLFRPVLGKGINLDKVVGRLAGLIG